LKGKNKSVSTHVPRKPIEEIKNDHKEQEIEAINLPLESPDLINHVRFTAEPARK
jgi:hypothetical protein